MVGSVKKVVAFASVTGPNCFTGDLAASAGAVTVVVVHGAGQCRDLAHGDMGVVFFGADPVMWTCLASSETAKFLAWGRASFPGARPMEVTANLGGVNCPPPDATAAELNSAAARVRAELALQGRTWLASAIPAAPRPAA
jgi:hypothetical protein